MTYYLSVYRVSGCPAWLVWSRPYRTERGATRRGVALRTAGVALDHAVRTLRV